MINNFVKNFEYIENNNKYHVTNTIIFNKNYFEKKFKIFISENKINIISILNN